MHVDMVIHSTLANGRRTTMTMPHILLKNVGEIDLWSDFVLVHKRIARLKRFSAQTRCIWAYHGSTSSLCEWEGNEHGHISTIANGRLAIGPYPDLRPKEGWSFPSLPRKGRVWPSRSEDGHGICPSLPTICGYVLPNRDRTRHDYGLFPLAPRRVGVGSLPSSSLSGKRALLF